MRRNGKSSQFCHPRMPLSEVQVRIRLDSGLKHAGMTDFRIKLKSTPLAVRPEECRRTLKNFLWDLLPDVQKFQTFNSPVVDDLYGYPFVLARLKRERHGAAVFLDQFFVDLGFEIARQPRPSVILAGHREKHLAREKAPAIVIGVEHPHSDLLVAAGFDAAGLGVVIVEA